MQRAKRRGPSIDFAKVRVKSSWTVLGPHRTGWTCNNVIRFKRARLPEQLPSESTFIHELGHVWIFTHHPYLQTEQLANRIAMRLVSRTSGSKLALHSYDSATGTWTTLASNALTRIYHSTTLLLPDGRVLHGGQDVLGYELYSPPYLFRGARPTITGAMPTDVAYGQTVFVETPDGAGIAQVTAGCAITHFRKNCDQVSMPSSATISANPPDPISTYGCSGKSARNSSSRHV